MHAAELMNEAQVKRKGMTFRKCEWTVVDTQSYLQLVSSAFNLINLLTILLTTVRLSCRKRLLDEPL